MEIQHKAADWQRRLGVVILFAFLAFLYISPAGGPLFTGRQDQVLSDDTDPSTLPYLNDIMIQEWRKSPSHFFYGSVYVDGHSPEGGLALWYPWNERFLNVFFSYFLPVEQINPAVIYSLLILNGLAMYALARYWGWRRTLAIALGIAWAFCAYTRGRAKVHGALTGTYHLPLVFLGLLLVARGKSWRSLALATLAFFGAVTVAHYYVVATAFLAPFLLAFLWLQPETQANLKRVGLRLTLAALPSVLFLAFNLAKPVPSDAKISAADSKPRTGETKPGEIHPFLIAFSARPIDYVAGDVAIGAADWNPIRGLISDRILKNLDNSNPHERANGIRWVVWALVILAAAALIKKQFSGEESDRRLMLFFFLLAGFGFWLSLSPNFPLPKMGPSYWLFQLMPQIRVPSRASTLVHFSFLLITGLYLSSLLPTAKPSKGKAKAKSLPALKGWKKFVWLPGVLPVLMVIDLPPLLQDMPLAPVRPAYQELSREKGPCGAGMYFPFVAHNWQLREQYHFLQRMRGSDCNLLNYTMNPERQQWLIQRFGLHPKMFELLQANDPRVTNALTTLVRCVPLTWLVFDERVPATWRESFCQQLGWQLHPDLSCTSPDKGIPLQRLPEQCL